MKIGQLDTQSNKAAAVAERRPAGAAAPSATSQTESEPSAKVALSQAGSTIVGSAAGDGSFDAEKVERIAAAIRDGKFKINPEAIADKLIQNAQELMGRPGAAR